jgi:pimeloyl-ACP methyl ester carboxylesterase
MPDPDMATSVLVHGAGSDSWYWHLVVPALRERGHDVVAVDLPCDDDSAAMVPMPGETPGEWWARAQSCTPFEKPWPLERWPDVATRFLLCRHDRFFPAEFMRRVPRERLGIIADEMDGGHLPALGRPNELVERLEAYRSEL